MDGGGHPPNLPRMQCGSTTTMMMSMMILVDDDIARKNTGVVEAMVSSSS